MGTNELKLIFVSGRVLWLIRQYSNLGGLHLCSAGKVEITPRLVVADKDCLVRVTGGCIRGGSAISNRNPIEFHYMLLGRKQLHLFVRSAHVDRRRGLIFLVAGRVGWLQTGVPYGRWALMVPSPLRWWKTFCSGFWQLIRRAAGGVGAPGNTGGLRCKGCSRSIVGSSDRTRVSCLGGGEHCESGPRSSGTG